MRPEDRGMSSASFIPLVSIVMRWFLQSVAYFFRCGVGQCVNISAGALCAAQVRVGQGSGGGQLWRGA